MRDVPPQFIEVLPAAENGRLYAITRIEELYHACAETQRLPHELGGAGWTAPAGGRDLRGYAFFFRPAGV